jgi:hypothetical protein
MLRDLHNNHLFSEAISPAAAVTNNTPFVSNVVDTLHWNGLEFVAHFGAIGNGTFTALVEDSPDNVTFTTVPAAELLGAVTPFVPILNETWKIGYVGVNRYVRVTITPVGNTGNIFLSAAWVQGNPVKPPYPIQFN